MKTAEQHLEETLAKHNLRMGWIPDCKNTVIDAIETFALQNTANKPIWISVESKDNLPKNLQYHLVRWELPHPEEGKPNVKGIRSAMCRIYGDQKWEGENGV